MGMKWYKFIIYVQLFFTVLCCIIMAWVSYAFAFADAENAYALLYPGVKKCEIIFMLIYAVYAVLCIVDWVFMKKYKKNGPALYIALCAASIMPIVNVGVLIAVVGGLADGSISALLPTIIIGVCVIGVLTVLNCIYFKKRRHLFVN